MGWDPMKWIETVPMSRFLTRPERYFKRGRVLYLCMSWRDRAPRWIWIPAHLRKWLHDPDLPEAIRRLTGRTR